MASPESAAWSVTQQGPSRLRLEHEQTAADTPYRYHAAQDVWVADGAAHFDLTLENRGETAMPFGFGQHPWLPRTPRSRLRFAAETTFRPDERTFPVEAINAAGDPADFSNLRVLEEMQGLDQHFAGWDGAARVEQPDEGYVLDMLGDQGYRNLHIFVPEDRPSFCAEPVTHVTDVVNRRAFAEFGDMARLATGEKLSARMTLRPEAIG